MKKSILIGVLAALMLFAFTACENTPAPNSLDLAVVGIEVEGTPSILIGGEPAASDYVVTATRYNGDTFTVAAEDLAFDFSKAEAIDTVNSSANKDAQIVGTVSYVGPYANLYGSVTSADLKAYVYKVESLTVTGVEDAKYYQNVVANGKLVNGEKATFDNTFRTADYTVTATYTDINDEQKTAVLAADQYEVTGFNDANIARVKLTFKPAGDEYSEYTQADGKNEAYVIIQEDPISSWSVAVSDDFDTEFVIGAAASTTTNIPANTSVVVTVNYASGAVVEITDGTGVTMGTTWKTGVTDNKYSGNSGTVDVTYNGETKTVTYNFVANTIKSFTVVASAQVAPGANLVASQLNVNATWKDDASATVEDSALRVTISENGYFGPDEKQHVYKITLTDYPSVPAQYVTVTAAAAQTTPGEETK